MVSIRDISLEQAIRESAPTRYCSWFTSGDIIYHANAKNVRTSRIGVSWLANKSKFSVTLATHGLETKFNFHELGDFPSIENLKEIFPKLFEVTGNLYVY